ncbi:asparagine synthase (glutamine-hydrolyzing) [Rhodobacteraceae bacterium 2CG4]|uniref:asparagine synthase (glutamine-hydrolyzing) n=1 Tax=Halovulum marinum TaxID=2662447 RepID=A0A6L5Z3H3_9RHOB|nr:asparagine synthase (glutamine-hydrolyzing) [Halovulum marinum]MSU90625.1 asparagine synthase (glutamine-hydrolyzing) [Halovulum marinum]
MCGIFGIAAFGARPDATALEAMRGALRHRGPDADGVAVAGGVGIGNVRLSILDLSHASDQPMLGADGDGDGDGDVALVQNGEIYNYVELREELIRAGAGFRTTGDTEVLLQAYLHWGPEFVTRLNGMFAIAVHDRRDGTLWLYRDRLGVKPLFLADTPQGVLFASEIKALLAAGVAARPSMPALAAFMAQGFVPPPATAFEGIVHLPPGSRARIDADGIAVERYWRLEDVAPDRALDAPAARAQVMELLDDATRLRLRSDAAFGAFLSGGLDSGTVVGLMARHMDRPVRSFSIGFEDPRFDETPHARAAAARFGAIHHTETAHPDIAALWPRFIYHCDQPHQDVSFMPTDLVSRLARREVKMVLTGDGGDELFAGYAKYLDLFPQGAAADLPKGWEDSYPRAIGLLTGDQPARLLRGALAQAWADADPFAPSADALRLAPAQDPVNRVLLADTALLLPGNNLVKPDRMAMANSLEVRSPFLDYRLAELAFRIPGELKLRGGTTKALLKDAVRPLLGPELTDRRKQMFTVPIGEWFQGALAPYCRAMLLDGRLAARGWLDADATAALVEAHLAGRENHTRQVRALISLEIWARLFLDRDPEMLAQATA